MSKIGFGKDVNMSFDEAVTKVTAALQTEGFGVLTEIDVAGTLKKKIDADMPPYRILGACNPALAHRGITAEPEIGMLLPCNVVVRQNDAGTVRVEFMDPQAILPLVDKAGVTELAGEVRAKLQRVMEAL